MLYMNEYNEDFVKSSWNSVNDIFRHRRAHPYHSASRAAWPALEPATAGAGLAAPSSAARSGPWIVHAAFVASASRARARDSSCYQYAFPGAPIASSLSR